VKLYSWHPSTSKASSKWYDFEHGTGTLGATGHGDGTTRLPDSGAARFRRDAKPAILDLRESGVRFDQLELLSDPEKPPSPATLMVLDFALSYSDDWFLIPIALDAWTIYETTAVAITDVFGDTTLANPPEGRWNMFRLDRHGSEQLSPLFIAASPGRHRRRPPLEEVHLLADEVANVAWAVERLTPHPLGESREAPPQPVTSPATAPSGLTWTLTPPSPPGNWFPLLPMSIGRPGARLTLECAYAETCRSRARRSASAATVASGRSAARGCADHPAVAIGARHRRVAALLDRPQQDATPHRYRPSHQVRRRGVEVATWTRLERLELEDESHRRDDGHE
jgi:hypothetical protein